MQTYTLSNSFLEEDLVRQLDSWTPPSIAKRVDTHHFLFACMTPHLPPWRPIPSRLAARFLGASLQSLANWRMRDLGPAPEPMRRGHGNRIYYRPDKIAHWLSGGECPEWRFSGYWFQQMGMPIKAPCEAAVRDRIAKLEGLTDLFPSVCGLWREFREVEQISVVK